MFWTFLVFEGMSEMRLGSRYIAKTLIKPTTRLGYERSWVTSERSYQSQNVQTHESRALVIWVRALVLKEESWSRSLRALVVSARALVKSTVHELET